MFSGFTKRITLLKQRNWGGNRAACAETGCFRDLQNELRCKNNGIGEETARRARKRGVFGIHKTNYVVKTTELGEETARRARSANGKLCGRRHAVKKVCEKRKLDGRGGIIPTAERLRGKNYAPEKCAAEIRQAGKRGITLSESLRHHPQHMVDGNAAMVVLRRFFIIIILS